MTRVAVSGTRFVHQQKCLLALHKIYRGAAGTKGLNIMMMLNNVDKSLDEGSRGIGIIIIGALGSNNSLDEGGRGG